MPNPHILDTAMYSPTSFGGIVVEPVTSSSAKVIFKIEDQQDAEGLVEFYELTQLEQLPKFKATQTKTTEQLIHTWYTKVVDGMLFKYASQTELALAFQMTITQSGISEDFKKLSEIDLPEFDYFVELRFIKLLEAHQLSLDQLQAIPGMDAEKITLLVNEMDCLNLLLNNGVTFKEITVMSTAKLSHLSKNIRPLDQLSLFGIAMKELIALDDERISLLAKYMTLFQDLVLQHGMPVQEWMKLDNARMKLLNENRVKVKTLIDQGVSVSQLALAKTETLIRCFSFEAYEMKKALRFLTPSQLFRLDHHPFSAPPLEKRDEELLYEDEDDLQEKFYVYRMKNTMVVTYAVPGSTVRAKLRLAWTNLEENMIYTIDSTKQKREQLIYHWCSETTQNRSAKTTTTTTTRYCFELDLKVTETADPEFPLTEFNAVRLEAFANAPYYYEKSFSNWLDKNNTSLDNLRSIPGMSPAKMKVLGKNREALQYFMDKGMVLSDFAKVTDNLLYHVLSDFTQAKSALLFVDCFELFGLRSPAASVNYSPRFHRRLLADDPSVESGQAIAPTSIART